MRQLFTRKNIIFILVAGAVLILLIAVYTFKEISKAIAETRQVDESLYSLQTVENLMDDLQDIESGQRGYVIARDSLFLTHYAEGFRNLGPDTLAVQQLHQSSPEMIPQYKALRLLVRNKSRLGARLVDLVSKGYHDSAIHIVQTGEGRMLMDSIRKIVFQIESMHREELQYANIRRKTAARISVGLLISALLLSILALNWLARKLLREEKARRDHERQITYLAGLSEQTSEAVFSTDARGMIKSWNKGAERLLGYSTAEVLGKFAPEITRSGTSYDEIIRISTALPEGGTLVQESRVLHKNGKELFCLGSVTELKNEQAEPDGFVIVLRDITERKEHEKLLSRFNEELGKQAEEKTQLLKNVVERVRDGFYSLDKDWRFTYVNEAAAREMNFSVKELTGASIWDKFPEGRQTVVYEAFQKALESQETQHLELYYEPFRKWFMMLVYPSQTGLSVFFRDISDVKRIEKDLERSNERFLLISRTTNDAVWEWDLETGELWGNAMHQRLYGLTAQEPVPKEQEWLNRLHPDDRDILVQRQREALESDTNVFITEYRFRTEEGGYRDIYDRCYIVRDETGKAIRMLGSMMDVTERKQAEEANREALQLLKDSELVGKTGYWKWNIKTNKVTWSEGTYRIFGETADGFGGTLEDFTRRIDSRDVDHVKEVIGKVMQEKKQSSYEFWIHTPSGERKYIRTTAEPHLDLTGEIEDLFGTTTDLTERKTAEEKIRESEAVYRALVENAVEALVVLDAEKGKFVNVSESAIALFKMSREELLKLGPLDLSPAIQPDGRSSAASAGEKIARAIAGEKPSFEWIHLDKYGNPIQTEVRLVRLPSENKILVRGSIIEISERKKAEEALRDSEETRRLIMNSALDAIVCINTRGLITVWTPQAEKIFGWTEQEALGLSLSDTIIPEQFREQHKAGMNQYLETGTGPLLNTLVEITGKKRDGLEFPIEISIIPVKRGGTEFFCAFIRDITARKKADMALKDSEEKIRHILSSSADDFYVIDRNYRVTLINATARKNLAEFFGKEVNTGDNILDLFPDDRKAFIKSNYEKVFQGDRVEYEFTSEIKGMPVWRRVSYSPVRDAEGLITGGFISTTDITDKKKAEEDIMKTNARFQVVSKATSDIVWDLNLTDQMLWWNDNYYLTLGYRKRNELMELQDWYDHIHPDDLERVRTKFLAAIAGEETTWRDEYRYRRADGTWLHILDRGYIMRTDQQRPYRMIGSMVDMTIVYDVQKRVIESENRLRTILDTDPECIKLMDTDCRLLDINKAGLAMIEAESAEQVIGQNLLQVVSEAQQKKAAEMVLQAGRGEEGRLEFEMHTLKGRKRWCEISIVPFRNADGEIISVLGVTRDITERKSAERELARNEEKYRTLVEQAADAIALYDAGGKVLDVNTGAVKLLGYSKAELVQLHLSDILTPEEITANPVRYDILQQGKSTVKQRKMKRKDGNVVETEVRSQQLPDGRFLSVIRDLSERIKTEKELQRYYKQLKELNSYLQNIREEERSNIAREIHDELGQQLTVLKMDISWLNKKLEPASISIKERLQGLLEMVDNTVRTVRRISAELRPSMLDDLGLAAAIEWQAQDFSKRTGLSVETHIEPLETKLPDKLAISLFRVFQESLTNAARHAECRNITVRLSLEDRRLVLSVQDDGKGFLPEHIGSKKTLGILGMKERIAIIQGEYVIESAPGRGTVVRVSVPVQEA